MCRGTTLIVAALLVNALLFGARSSSSQKSRSQQRKPFTSLSKKKPAPAKKRPLVTKKTAPKAKPVRIAPAAKKAPPRPKPLRRARTFSSPWREPTYADSTLGDFIDGEDLDVRRAAVEALGPYNGSVVVADPSTGRILTMVNQKLALKSGFQPCSTIKLVPALAALREGLIERHTLIRTGAGSMNLTTALARSANGYFAVLGERLGFSRVIRYARLLGLGEKAGWNISGEESGVLPSSPPRNGGVGRMSSFGEGIKMTPLQLTALLGAVHNGGTLYFLQYPRSEEEAERLVPRLKRRLDIAPWLDDLKAGLRAAVDYGTGRRADVDSDEPVLGKTGTCTDYGEAAHLGWFGSFIDADTNPLVVVVLLTGGKPVNGPVAAGIAGRLYEQLLGQSFFARKGPPAQRETTVTVDPTSE